MRTLTATIACVALTACASAPSRLATFGEAAQGRYSLVARAEGVTLRGDMQVLRDTILLNLERTDCRRDAQVVSNIVMAYKCDPVDGLTGIVVNIDRRQPSRASSWRTVVEQKTFVRTCMGVAVSNGREYCVRYEDVPSVKSTSVFGELIFAREVAAR